jgi:23S rRNA (pseudouridine1915-N3)-methyltransferase
MQKITLLCVGKVSTSWVGEGCKQYLDRIKTLARVDVHEIDDSREKDPDRQRRDESARLLSAMAKHKGDSIVLDETGERCTSEAFAKLIGQMFDSGSPAEFVIGGAHGLSEEVRKTGKRVLRLSDMTLPHELARLFLVEQIYRALQIQRGSGYHH